MLIPIHVKSDRSLGYGTAAPFELVETAARLGLPALALTDRDTLAGQPLFHAACRARGIRAITGLELIDEARLVLLARDRLGYEALCRIATARATRRPRPDAIGLLEREPVEHLFVLSDQPCALSALIERGVTRSALGLLLVRPSPRTTGAERIDAADALGVRLVADRDIVMVSPNDRALHALQVAVHRRERVAAVERRGLVEHGDRSFSAEAAQAFADCPDALENATDIAEACELDLLSLASSRRDGQREAEALQRIAARCRSRLTQSAPHARRLEHELSVIGALGLARYFEVALDVAEEAQARSIPIAVRGSAVSSLVVHLLGLSPIDPLEHGLIFERFLHAARAELPDIDLDVAHDQRDALIARLIERRGSDHVSPIASYATWQRRSAYRAGLTAMGAPRSTVERVLSALPPDELALPVPASCLPAELGSAHALIERLIARPSHLSVHASGLALSEPPLHGLVPFTRAPKGVVTQYDGHALEALGVLKLDLLGNRALTERARTLRYVARDVAEPLPLTDRATWQALQRADTVACFQVETPLVRALLRQHSVGSLDELAAVLARARPGPAADGALVYEEDLIRRIAEVLACTLGHADTLRRAIVTGQLDEAGFIAEARGAGVGSSDAGAAWHEFAPFAAYAFSKAHALSFARIAYDCAYLKSHWPAPFAAAVIDHHGGMYSLRTLVSDLQRSGVTFALPSVQRSERHSAVLDGSVVVGLEHIKHLRASTRARLVQARPFRDLRDMIERVRPRADELRALIRSGACDELAPLSAEAFPFAHDYWLQRIAIAGVGALAQPAPSFQPRTARDASRLPVYRALRRVQVELELLGMHITEHPMRVLRLEAERVECTPSSMLAARAGERVRFAGLVAALRRALTKRGEIMCFATFEDEHGLVEAVLPPRALVTLGDAIDNPGPFLLSARVRDTRGLTQLDVEALMPFYRRDPAPSGRSD